MNALSPIVFILFVMDTITNDEQPWNAFVPIDVIVSENDTAVMLEYGISSPLTSACVIVPVLFSTMPYD